MSGPMATCAEVLSEFTHDLRPGAIPREVRENVSLRVLDILGIALASTAQDFAPAVLGVVEAWGSGECTVIGTKLRAAPPMAILANGSLAHGLDYDDTHTVAICHASAVVVPTALALGESLGLDGAAVLAAMVAGYETMTRIGGGGPPRPPPRFSGGASGSPGRFWEASPIRPPSPPPSVRGGRRCGWLSSRTR